jgi:hypothetical protein
MSGGSSCIDIISGALFCSKCLGPYSDNLILCLLNNAVSLFKGICMKWHGKMIMEGESENVKIKTYESIIIFLFYMGVKSDLSPWGKNINWRCSRTASHISHFIPRETAPGNDWIECWIDPRAGLDMVAQKKKKKKNLPLLRIKPCSPVHSLVTIQTKLPWLKKKSVTVWNEFIWLRIEPSGRLLWTW